MIKSSNSDAIFPSLSSTFHCEGHFVRLAGYANGTYECLSSGEKIVKGSPHRWGERGDKPCGLAVLAFETSDWV